MADVFISYKSERRPAAKHLASIIEAHGFSVWFDYDLVPGKNFGKAIEAELRQAKAALVLWCSKSIGSEWVREEADLAKRLGIFVPARIELCEPPLGFRLDDFVDISSWDGDPSTRSLDRLIDRIETLVGRESVMARRKLVELHQSWTTLGRPTLARFALGAKREIADEDRRLPSSVGEAAAPAPSPSTVSTGHDYAFWERQWDKQAGGDNLVALRVIADEAPRYFAEQAAARIAEIDEQRRPKPLSQTVNRILSGELTAGQLLFERAQAIEGRIKVDAKIIHGAPADLAGGGWFLPGAGKTEWFKDLDIGPEMVVVPAGSFVMGSIAGNSAPTRSVAIRAPLAIGRFAITFDDWDAAVAAGGRFAKPGDENWGRSRRPVVNVSWDDAKAYCEWFSKMTGKFYRLLSEAEWEYCCREGTTTGKAHFSLVSGEAKKTVAVGSYAPNEWGIFDMHGNVWEWCEDSWHENYSGAPNDGSVWLGSDTLSRVVRGGSWYNTSPNLDFNSTRRFSFHHSERTNHVGFRVARTL